MREVKEIFIPQGEYWDEKNECFIYTKAYTLRLANSLLSISDWESKYHKSWFETNFEGDEFLDYIKCMNLTPNVPDDVYLRLTQKDVTEILDYIKDPMTATRITSDKKTVGRDEYVTSEIIYYWMAKFGIPFEAERWHINRLIMLIRVCIEKEKPPKKMSEAELHARHAQISARNRARRAKKG